MIKGPLVTQAEKSSSDPRWKRGCTGAGMEVARHMAADPLYAQNTLPPGLEETIYPIPVLP